MLQKVGYDIVKYHQTYVVGHFDAENLQGEYPWLKDFKFMTILDIGANEGQFADKMHALFPETMIYSFEPIPEAFELLDKNFKDISQIKGINLALGDSAGEIIFNKNESSASSSFLDMADSHVESFDFAVKTVPIKVKVDTLDNVMCKENIDLPMLIKIDVQGFEDKVIRGGTDTIKKAAMVICEVSFTELYKGQLLFDDTYEIFKNLGFTYAGSVEQLRSPVTNRILQADALFIKTK
jgi:FkbM family methyltransferase